MKRILAVAGTLLLAACGHDTRTTAALGTLVVPNQAPWLILAPGPDKLDVKGLEQSVQLQPDPPLATALEAQLRAAVQPDYFTNLTIGCNDLKAQMRGGSEDAPDRVDLELALHCTINARGYVSQHDYESSSSTTVPTGSDADAYARALAVLLRDGAGRIATQLKPDVRSSLRQ
jgi:hypothetical protein